MLLEKYKKLIVISVSFFISFCSNEIKNRDDYLKKLILQDHLLKVIENNPHVGLIDKAFKKWNLYINYEVSHSRVSDKFKNHWIEISDNFLCLEEGLLRVKIKCDLGRKRAESMSESIFGMCLPEHYESGEIHTTTLALNSETINSLDVTDTYKINSIAHEIGHCFGLKHVDDINNIMSSNIEEYDYYNFEQREIIKDIREGKNPTPFQVNKYFITSFSNNFLRHSSKPYFSIKVK